jgi:hypothetical protein
MKQLTLELVAIRAILEVPDSTRPSSTEELDAMTREIFAAFRPRPIAKTQPATSGNVVAFRKAGAR